MMSSQPHAIISFITSFMVISIFSVYVCLFCDEDFEFEESKEEAIYFTQYVFFWSFAFILSSAFSVGMIWLFCGCRFEAITAVKLSLALLVNFIFADRFSNYTSNKFLKGLSRHQSYLSCVKVGFAIWFFNKMSEPNIVINLEKEIALTSLRFCAVSAMVLAATKSGLFNDDFFLPDENQGQEYQVQELPRAQ